MCTSVRAFYTIILIIYSFCSPPTVGLNLDHAFHDAEFYVENRISGGDLAAENQFPYQVGLNIEVSMGVFNWCGGSLISNEWILTAAHCVHSITAVIAYLGAIYRLEPKKTYQIPLCNIHLHEQFNKNSLHNDIALLRLPLAVALSDAIHPITLPKLFETHSAYAYQEAITSGWGRENDASASISSHLRYVIRYTLTNPECQFVYGNSVRPTNICIDTTGGKSTCSGDSGGPLVVHDDHVNGLVQIGLTSFGKSSGCTNGNPAVFTRLTGYLEWIYQTAGVANI